jgi:hypothetical protein
LIRCNSIRSGNKSWTDVRDRIHGPAAQALFQQLAQQQRAEKEITFTGLLPHFQPGTKKIVVPRR